MKSMHESKTFSCYPLRFLRRGYAIVLAAIVALGITKEVIDVTRFGTHHTSVQAKVSANGWIPGVPG